MNFRSKSGRTHFPSLSPIGGEGQGEGAGNLRSGASNTFNAAPSPQPSLPMGEREKPRPSPRAFVLVAVLIIVMLLSMLVVSLLFRFKAEDTAASASVGTEQAWAAALSGVEEALRVASAATPGLTDWQDNPAAFRDRLVFDDGGERWFFTVFSPGGGETLADIRYGLTDEAGKLNVNALADASLEKLPRFTPAMAAALLDFIDEDDVPRPEGAEQDYYSGLPRPYTIRNGPLATLEELLLVRGFTAELLNGSVAPRESGTNSEAPPSAGDSRPARGLGQFLTVVSYDPDTANDGSFRVNFNSPDAVLPAAELPPLFTNFLAALQSNGVTLSHAADLLEAKLPVKDAKGLEVEITSGIGKAELATVLDLFTASPELQTDGLVNVNTASIAVLATLPGVDEPLAESIVSARRSLSPERRTTIAWLYQEGVVDAAKFKVLAPLLTARSFQFTCQVIGYGLPSGRYRVLEVGVDVAPGTRRITYLRDVTRRGLPFTLGGEGEGQPAKSAMFRPRPVGRDSVEPHFERSEASAASISVGRTPGRDARSARASSVGKAGSTESGTTRRSAAVPAATAALQNALRISASHSLLPAAAAQRAALRGQGSTESRPPSSSSRVAVRELSPPAFRKAPIRPTADWNLKFGACLEFGIWNLEFPTEVPRV